jgi:hypothetical protein
MPDEPELDHVISAVQIAHIQTVPASVTSLNQMVLMVA